MGQLLVLNPPQRTLFYTRLITHKQVKLQQFKPCWFNGVSAQSLKCHCVQLSLQGSLKVIEHVESSLNYNAFDYNEGHSDDFPHVQTLRNFTKEQLVQKVVLVRFDSTILLREEADGMAQSASNAVFTIKYLHAAGARVILASDWRVDNNLKSFDAEFVADFLSSLLHYKVVPAQCVSLDRISKMQSREPYILLLDNLSELKEDVANCPKFAEALSSGVDIFVNDSFSQCHKILASTVGVARFCSPCLAGFHFEESLNQLIKVKETNRKPYVAIIGGGSIRDKVAALQFLASRCDALIFVGMMSFQIMHALGLSVPLSLVDHGAVKEAFDIVQFAQRKNVQITYPKDFLCENDRFPGKFQLFPSHGIMEGWVPVDIGPVSLDEIQSLLTKCKKTLWIGSVKFCKSNCPSGAYKLAQILDQLSQSACDITVVGNMACEAIMKESSSVSVFNMVYGASVVWEFLKGRKLPSVIALDRAYPFYVDWNRVYSDPSRPLVVDIGSGNGLFLFGMAKRRKDLNFLGLEINKKLVRRCLDSPQTCALRNRYFIAANATSTFRSIISSYPGKLVLVSILCPNPDFNNPEHRWRMVQRSLVEAIVELLVYNGKVFLQSDIEAVSLRMKEEFLKHGKGKLIVLEESDAITEQGWLKDNPFGVYSDWEQHVLDRGDPMYRLMLSKSTSSR
ncbi:hypothetical protein UlMin_045437 [Ulmus minor]